jgi:hypothetical protein
MYILYMYKSLLLLVIFIGILLITIEIVKVLKDTEKIQTKTEYRYMPRTLEEEQLEPVYVSEIFDTMFSEASPWIFSIRNYDQQKQEKINQYFVNQL